MLRNFSVAATETDDAVTITVTGEVDVLTCGDVDTLLDYRTRAPGVRYAHPTVDHFVPLFVSLGASLDKEIPDTVIEGYFLGLSKRSVQFD